MRNHKIRWEEMLPHEFLEARDRHPVCYIEKNPMKQTTARIVLAVALPVAGWLAALPVAADVEIVRDGEARAVIVARPDLYPARSRRELETAATRLSALVEQSTGAKLPVATSPAPDQVAIYLGEGPHLEAFGLSALEFESDDTFEIVFPDEHSIVIAGKLQYGIAYGVDEFLERYVGVRWLMPGPFGTDVPEHATLAIPAVKVRQTPSFESRLLSIAAKRNPIHVWADRNRMVARMTGAGHNLNNLFAFHEYKQHPEYFPLTAKGERFTPSGKQGWQPCFDPAVTAGPAIERLTNLFSRWPEQQSYSLTVNDNGNYCRCAVCAPGMRGYSYSETYYRWVNAVVEGVLQQYPGKQFGLLAYNNVIAPPSYPVNAAVIPWITQDRLKWIDPEVRENGENLTRGWRAKVPVIAWYDYIYGAAYLLPRVYFHQMAETLRFGYDHGVRHYYAEAYPNFGEGPKLYVLLKLLWNIDADVDALLTEWYERVGGQEAAPLLAQYYAFFEDFWTRRILESSWYQKSGIYMPVFNDPDYLLDVTPAELASCRRLIEQALAKAGTPDQQARVRTLFDAFELYEASALAYQGSTPRPIGDAQAALDALNGAVRAFELHKRRIELATVVFPANPVLALSDMKNRLKFGPERGLWETFMAVQQWAGANPGEAGNVLSRLKGIQEEYKESELGRFAEITALAAAHPDRLTECVVNGSFEDDAPAASGAAQADASVDWRSQIAPSPWYLWVPEYAPNTEVSWSDSQGRTGSRCMKISGPGKASILQLVPVEPGQSFIVSVAFNARLDDMEGRAGLSVQWKAPNGSWTGGISATMSLQPGAVTDGWVTRESSLIRAPEGVASMVLNIGLTTSNPEDYLLIDDVSVKQIEIDRP